MFKLVVLSALVAVATAAPAPGLLHGYGGYGYALPAATSYSSRVDVHHKPIITAYAAPVIAKTVIAAPAVSYAAPLAVGHGYGAIHAAPLVSGYGGYGGYGLGHGLGHGIGLSYGGYGHGW